MPGDRKIKYQSPIWLYLSTLILLFIVDVVSGNEIEPDQSHFDKIHLLIPGGAGGGWDSTARAVGEALRRSHILERVSYENRSGGGGGVAIAYLIETAKRQHNTAMVGSSALVVRSLNGVLPQGLADLTPIASVVADYFALAVRADSPYQDFADLRDAFNENPKAIHVAGGSVRGGLDHLVVELVMTMTGAKPGQVSYVAYDGGGQANTSLLSGETTVLSTNVSEIVSAHQQGQVRILGITSPERLPELPDVPTFRELDYDAVLANWRGFFGAPGLPNQTVEAYARLFDRMMATSEWETQRARLALTNYFMTGKEFELFLRQNEIQIRNMIDKLRKPREGEIL